MSILIRTLKTMFAKKKTVKILNQLEDRTYFLIFLREEKKEKKDLFRYSF